MLLVSASNIALPPPLPQSRTHSFPRTQKFALALSRRFFFFFFFFFFAFLLLVVVIINVFICSLI